VDWDFTTNASPEEMLKFLPDAYYNNNFGTVGISIEDELLQNVMRTDLTTFDPSTELSTAISTASRKNIRHLPVVEGDKIVGMVTFRDLVSYLLPEICYMAKEVY
jgi:CBS domain-containing protein